MKALIIVDVQNDFCPGGKLVVEGGQTIIPTINRLSLSGKFDLVIATQDWHPAGHISFASRTGDIPFNQVEGKTVWPDHCVQGSWGAEFRIDLNSYPINIIIRKGMNIDVDSYSAFEDDEKKHTGLQFLVDEIMDEVYIVGIATDVCVKATVSSALMTGTKVHVIEDACAGVTKEGAEEALIWMVREGAFITNSTEVLK